MRDTQAGEEKWPKYGGGEGKAKAAKRGLWVDKDPMPPWEFRRLR